eukprot:CAMPEP_0206151598 /NCGR_PEP_ID=MMETSP1473-20131121/38902_1 /ASSEMBLY_ACC=CAM_ASM_001109 /TAXON_ID=1461547 /ORGANISM="Stichococcus sp, Strain RCC1054" /LENGTH=158 /DNA_ID=CAMNT_0053549145 /DNA_START=56 /DNA_END=532 /DNA_ORIENTATION=+
MAELHISGEIEGCKGFPGSNLFCEWGIAVGDSWEVLQGLERGRTQVDSARGSAFWAHPLDMHLIARGLAGWPKLHFQIWSRQKGGRAQIRGYGFCHVPATPGVHAVECSTWRPQQSAAGGIVHSGEDRFRLQTVTSGIVRLRLNVLVRNFQRYHVQLA